MKYPRIPHTSFSNITDPDDIVTKDAVFGREWIVTEKVDGAQVGIQFIDGAPDVRNRNTDILHGGSDRQFHPFATWFKAHADALWNLVGNDRILFGEWLFHVHTARYTKLPDWFVAFGLLRKSDEIFLPFYDAMNMIVSAGLCFVPVLGTPVLKNEAHLLSFITTSRFGEGEMEGVVLHSADEKYRVKYVTRKFKDAIDHDRHWRWEPYREKNALAIKPT